MCTFFVARRSNCFFLEQLLASHLGLVVICQCFTELKGMASGQLIVPNAMMATAASSQKTLAPAKKEKNQNIQVVVRCRLAYVGNNVFIGNLLANGMTCHISCPQNHFMMHCGEVGYNMKSTMLCCSVCHINTGIWK